MLYAPGKGSSTSPALQVFGTRLQSPMLPGKHLVAAKDTMSLRRPILGFSLYPGLQQPRALRSWCSYTGAADKSIITTQCQGTTWRGFSLGFSKQLFLVGLRTFRRTAH